MTPQAPSRIQRPRSAADASIRKIVHRIMRSCQCIDRMPDRRLDARIPFPHPVQMVPLDARGILLVDESFSVIGKHLAERGLDFYHHEPLAYRRVVATIGGDDALSGLVVDLAWCRFNQHGWYESGGRFLGMMEVSERAAG